MRVDLFERDPLHSLPKNDSKDIDLVAFEARSLARDLRGLAERSLVGTDVVIPDWKVRSILLRLGTLERLAQMASLSGGRLEDGEGYLPGCP